MELMGEVLQETLSSDKPFWGLVLGFSGVS